MQALSSQTLVLAPPGHSMPTGTHKGEAHTQHCPSGQLSPHLASAGDGKTQQSTTAARRRRRGETDGAMVVVGRPSGACGE